VSKLQRSSLSLVLILLGSACPTAPSGEAPPASSGPTAAVASAADAGARVASTPFTERELTPRLQALGPPGAIPTEVAVYFPLPVADEAWVKTGTAGTSRVRLEPKVEGTLRFSGLDTLTFKPSRPFAPGARYRLAVERLDTVRGALDAPPASWSLEFVTPSPELLGMDLDELDAAKGTLAVVLHFSAPLARPTELRSQARLTLDGQPLQPRSAEAVDDGSGVRLTVKVALGPEAAGLAVDVPAGLAFRDGAKLDAAAHATAVLNAVSASAPSMTVKGVVLRESRQGFTVRVVCSDGAEPDERYYWDRDLEESYDHMSKRCAVSLDEARRFIRVSPKVAFTLAEGNHGFELVGPFKQGAYDVTLLPGLKTGTGATLRARVDKALQVPARKPMVSFVAQGRYLPRSAWTNLGIRHLNVPEVTITVRQVPPENLVYWMSAESEDADERLANTLAVKQVRLKSEVDAVSTSWLDLGSFVPADSQGVLQVTLSEAGAHTAARVLLTPFQLVAKRGAADAKAGNAREVWVWALDMSSGEPVTGVEVQLVKKSGQVVSRCTTAGPAGCKVKEVADALDGSLPFAVVARKDRDFTYLKYAELETDLAEADVSGEAAREAPYRAALYSDRGVYRPGETAHLAAVLRDQRHRAPPTAMPLELQLLDPRQQLSKKWTLNGNEAGLVTQDIAFADYADTGRYTLKLLVADLVVGELALNVEEFVPERMKVELVAAKPDLLASEPASFLVNARYLFGGVPAGSPLELSCALTPAPYGIEGKSDFDFGQWTASTPRGSQLEPTKDELGSSGNASARCGKAPPSHRTMRLDAQVAVFEAGSGRSTVRSASAWVHPERWELGLKTGATVAAAGEEVRFEGVVVDWKGAPLAKGPASVTLEWVRVEQEYGWWWDEGEGGESYKPHLKPVLEASTTVPVQDGRFSYVGTPALDAFGYVLTVRAGQAQSSHFVAGRGDWYWGGDGRDVARTPRPSRATPLLLKVARTAKVGQTLKVATVAPFPGWLLLTTETDGVVSAEWKKVPAGALELQAPVSHFAPTVYVSALLVKDPHAESVQGFLPDRAFGVVPVAIEPTEHRLELALTAPKEVRSGSTLEVGLKASPAAAGTYATVAVVDEGVLSLTRFQSPDPLATLFAKRALGVATYETVGWSMLLPAPGPSKSTGGDEGGSHAGRVQPVKPVALWSGVVKLDASGAAVARFTLPPYRGAVRVMAVAVSDQRVGSASQAVTVTDPLVVQATLPRFVSQGDELLVPVFVSNLSGGPLDVHLTLSSENVPVPGLSSPLDAPSPLKLLGKPEGQVQLKPGESRTLVFHATSVEAVGAARVRVVAQAGALTASESAEVPLQPAQPRERLVQTFKLTEGTLDLKPHLAGWVPSTERTTVWVSTNPYARSFDRLTYLLHYPYGCVEQTTSSMRPLLFVQSLVGDVDPVWASQHPVEDMVKAGIDRLFTMQTPSGGIGYWPGASEPHLWGTAYAAHALHEAQALGYPVPAKRLDDALDWLGQQSRSMAVGGTGNEHGYRWNVAAYVHYVLALTGRGNKAEISRALAAQAPAPRGAELEGTYLLKAALYLAGDRRFEADLKAPPLEALVSKQRDLEYGFYSDDRAPGMLLNVLQDLKLQDEPAALELAARVADGLADSGRSRYYNTQEVVWGVTGLGKRLLAAAARLPPPTLLGNGKAVAATGQAKASPQSRSYAVARASELASLELKLAEKPQGEVFVVVNSEGVRAQPTVRYGGQGLQVARVFHRAGGEVFDPRTSPLALSELAYVEVKLTNPRRVRVANLALVDGLPAGFEIENPRLQRGTTPAWVDADSQWKVDALNVRDNRLELFGALEGGATRSFVYAVRAVTGGRFTQPPLEVEAMYDATVWAREPGGALSVTAPWKDEIL
jgi:alpha-2-macroglobulin